MTAWHDYPGSVVAPLLLGYTRDEEIPDAHQAAWTRAIRTVPAVDAVRPRLVDGKAKQLVHRRAPVEMQEHEAEAGRVRLRPQRAGETDVPVWDWEVAYWSLPPGSSAVLPPQQHVLLLQVTRFQVFDSGVYMAPQLALFRASFVQAVRLFDPYLTVRGGQHTWNRQLWASTPAA